MTTENSLGHSGMAYTTAVVSGGFGQKDMREMDQFLYEKDASSVCDICVQTGLLWSSLQELLYAGTCACVAVIDTSGRNLSDWCQSHVCTQQSKVLECKEP